MNIGIGTYTKEDYPEIRRISKDRDNLDETWAAWKRNKDKTKKGFKRPGFNLVDIPVKRQRRYDNSRISGEIRHLWQGSREG